MNTKKSVFMSDHKNFKTVDEVTGIKKVHSCKYLGIQISLDRRLMLEEASRMIITLANSILNRL